MRADRLLSLLMLLQNRGRMTARELAVELEVSGRTIYRDIEALGTAGVPIYSEHGPGGGIALLDSYRTDLTGLTTSELQALFALSIPAPLAELGLRQDFQSALLKLTSSLPSPQREKEERLRSRIHLDWQSWSGLRHPTPYLGVLYKALFNDCQVTIRYPLLFGQVVEKTVDPLGLVTKSGVWYLVCRQNEQIKVHAVSSLNSAFPNNKPFSRPAGFELDRFWQEYCRRVEENHTYYAVILRVQPAVLSDLERTAEQHAEVLETQSVQDDEGLIVVRLVFFSLAHARSRLMGLGGAIEVLEPCALRLSMADFARQILLKYRGKSTGLDGEGQTITTNSDEHLGA